LKSPSYPINQFMNFTSVIWIGIGAQRVDVASRVVGDILPGGELVNGTQMDSSLGSLKVVNTEFW